MSKIEMAIPGVLIGVSAGGLVSGIGRIIDGDRYGIFVVYLATILLLSGVYIFFRNVRRTQ